MARTPVPGMQESGSRTPKPQAPDSEGLAGQWRSWLEDPDNRAALLSFGAHVMQPKRHNTLAGHIGRAVGAAGETMTRRGQARREERTAGARETAADASMLRAAGGGSGGLTAGQALTHQRAQQKAFQDFLGSKAEQLFMEGGDFASAGEALTAMLNDPELMQEALAEWQQFQGATNMALGEAIPQAGGQQAQGPDGQVWTRQGDAWVSPDGQRMVRRNGQWVQE